MIKNTSIKSTENTIKNSTNKNERSITMNSMKKEPAMKEIVTTGEGIYTVEVEKFPDNYVCRVRPQTSNHFEPSYVGFLENLSNIYANALAFTKMCFSPYESCELALAVEKMDGKGEFQRMYDLLEAIGEYESELATDCDNNEDDEEEDTPQEKLDELNDIIDFLYDEAEELLDSMRSFRSDVGMQE